MLGKIMRYMRERTKSIDAMMFKWRDQEEKNLIVQKLPFLLTERRRASFEGAECVVSTVEPPHSFEKLPLDGLSDRSIDWIGNGKRDWFRKL